MQNCLHYTLVNQKMELIAELFVIWIIQVKNTNHSRLQIVVPIPKLWQLSLIFKSKTKPMNLIFGKKYCRSHLNIILQKI